MPEEESYWERRERNNIKREQMKDAEVAERLRQIIETAMNESEKEIYTLYAKYADQNGLTLAEAKKRVSEMDIQNYERTAARYVREREFSPEANQMLSTYNTKMRISRQELLMMYLNAHLVVMADKQIKTFQEYLEQAGIAEVQRQAGILGANIQITAATLQSLVGASFYDATWSSRIWNDMEALREELSPILNSAIIRGKHPNQFVPKLRERFEVSLFEAKRLLITETARVQTEAAKLSFEAITEDLEEEEAEYQFVAFIDEKTTKICKGLDGKRFKVKDMQPGVNAAPMHPFCRSFYFLVNDGWREKLFGQKKYVL